MSDAEDLDVHLPAIAAGDSDAFGLWVAGAEPVLRRSLRAFAAAVDSESVVQEALLRVWQFAPRCRRDGKANGLLRFGLTAARNLAASWMRRQRFGEGAIEELARQSDRDVAAMTAPDPLLRELISDCFAKLPPQPSRALKARLDADGGAADRELAGALAMKLNTFLQNVTRARRLLAECLRRAGVELPQVSP